LKIFARSVDALDLAGLHLRLVPPEALAHAGNEAGLYLFLGHGLLIDCESLEPFGRHKRFNDESPDDREGSDSNAPNVLAPVETRSAHDLAANLAHHDLTNEDNHEDQKELKVVEETSEDVELAVAELACVEEVENGHHDETLENEGVQRALSSRSVVDAIAVGSVCEAPQDRVGAVKVLIGPEFGHKEGLFIIVVLKVEQ
jgi:hypothetical protein